MSAENAAIAVEWVMRVLARCILGHRNMRAVDFTNDLHVMAICGLCRGGLCALLPAACKTMAGAHPRARQPDLLWRRTTAAIGAARDRGARNLRISRSRAGKPQGLVTGRDCLQSRPAGVLQIQVLVSSI